MQLNPSKKPITLLGYANIGQRRGNITDGIGQLKTWHKLDDMECGMQPS